jgi:hypothetical protein
MRSELAHGGMHEVLAADRREADARERIVGCEEPRGRFPWEGHCGAPATWVRHGRLTERLCAAHAEGRAGATLAATCECGFRGCGPALAGEDVAP